ncbi:hypothetical protein [Listeria costaricensis]|uniref:hypothetical protein n=1 Tax=Listeria costaricensis TaxID=2026604 RepID=UPI000C07F472|nr:hypothetical protein [Listeria costaricensis]
MEEKFDLGHCVKKAFVIAAGVSLVFIGIMAFLTLIGVIIAIPLLKKGSKYLLQANKSAEEELPKGGKLKLKCGDRNLKLKFDEAELLDEKS